MASEEQKYLWNCAEQTSFDLEHRLVIIKFPHNTTTLAFDWIKNVYPQIVKLEEHVLAPKPSQEKPR